MATNRSGGHLPFGITASVSPRGSSRRPRLVASAYSSWAVIGGRPLPWQVLPVFPASPRNRPRFPWSKRSFEGVTLFPVVTIQKVQNRQCLQGWLRGYGLETGDSAKSGQKVHRSPAGDNPW